MKEYRIEFNGKTFILNEREIYSAHASNFCIKLDDGQFKTILEGLKNDGAVITEI